MLEVIGYVFVIVYSVYKGVEYALENKKVDSIGYFCFALYFFVALVGALTKLT